MLTAHARVAPLRWFVFVELPVEEAYAPLYELIKRSGILLFGALFLAALAGMFLARKMVVPIQALREGAERIGRGELNQRISVKTGDELEALADQFNDMAGRLEDSYADLERKVEERTQELARSVQELQALGEVSHAVNSTLDLETLLSTIVAKAVQLSATDAGAIYVFSKLRQKFRLRATYGMSDDLIAAIGDQTIGLGESYIGGATQRRSALQIPDLADEPQSAMRDLVLGVRAIEGCWWSRSCVQIASSGRLLCAAGSQGCFRNRPSTSYRLLPRNQCSRSRTRACSARSSRRVGRLKSQVSTNRNSWRT